MTDLLNYLADSTLFWWAFATIIFFFALLTGYLACLFTLYPETLPDVFMSMFFWFVTLFFITAIAEITYHLPFNF